MVKLNLKLRMFRAGAFSLLAWAALLFLQQPAWAAPDDVASTNAGVQPAEDEVNGLMQINIDQNIFGAQDVASGRQRLLERLKLQLDELHTVCGLTAEQRQKLELAAEGDINPFFERLAAIHKKYGNGAVARDAFNQMWQEVQPLREQFSKGLFGDDSFFAKTLNRTLTPEQKAKREELVKERNRYRYEADIESTLAMIENNVPFKQNQHETLVKMLLAKSTPKYGGDGNSAQFLIFFRLAQLPREELKSLLDAKQQKGLEKYTANYRNMGNHLAQLGLIDAEEVAAAAPPARPAAKKKPPRRVVETKAEEEAK